MKKKLLSIACAATLALSASAASDPGLTQVWLTPFLEIGDWDGSAADWSSSDAIKGGPCARFATARDGKVYTVNMKTMSIAEVTDEGLKDVYKLPPLSGTDIYGTAISLDEAGNFLIGKEFVTPASSLNWAIYSPKTGQAKQIVLDTPEGWTIGRIDCVGHVLGDLTRDALFFISPAEGNFTQKVRVIKVTGNGTVNSVEFETIGGVEVPASKATYQGIVQPAFATYADYTAAGEDNYNFYYSACSGVNTAYASYIDGVMTPNFAPDMAYSINSGVNGFDTFVLDGKRYFVRSYSMSAGAREMGFAVMDANGDILSTYMNTDYQGSGGYSTLVAEPLDDSTANIYIYFANGKGVQAAQVTFNPSQCGAPIVPEKPVGVSPDDPYKVTTTAEFLNMASKISGPDFYVVLENDLDFSGIDYTPVASTSRIHFDGKNHVISNVYTYDPKWDNWGLFKAFSGEIKNLGLENSYHYVSSGCAGAFMGEANNVTIENCYATGEVYAAAGGGFIGTVVGTATITNCYSLVAVSGGANAYVAGLVGRVGSYNGAASNLTVTYSYAGGSVITQGGTAAGIAASNVAESSITIDQVIAWNSAVSGGSADPICAGLCDNADLKEFWIADGLLLNGEPEVGSTQAELLGVVAEWPAFNKKLNNGHVVLAWQEANGEENALGTEANPIKVYTAQDLVNMRRYFVVGDNYITIENDIDMAGVAYTAPLGNNNFQGRVLHIDGKCHVIDNLTVSDGDYPSLIGVFMGEIKNLGMTNVNISSASSGVGVFGAFTGHKTYEGLTLIDNCFATGEVKGAYYAGGLGGYNNGQLKISNCYTFASVEANSFAGGVLGWVPAGVTTIENVYAANYVEATEENGVAGGIINLVDEGVATLNNVVSWGEGIYATTAAFINGGAVAATESNVYVGEAAFLNGETAFEDAKTNDDLVAIVSAWEAFSDELTEGKPMLKWQADKDAGVKDIISDEANGPAVYYNLQGVRVANPENGIYIVRRGNKVTKELVR